METADRMRFIYRNVKNAVFKSPIMVGGLLVPYNYNIQVPLAQLSLSRLRLFHATLQKNSVTTLQS
jgi:hypothetical protein